MSKQKYIIKLTLKIMSFFSNKDIYKPRNFSYINIKVKLGMPINDIGPTFI